MTHDASVSVGGEIGREGSVTMTQLVTNTTATYWEGREVETRNSAGSSSAVSATVTVLPSTLQHSNTLLVA